MKQQPLKKDFYINIISFLLLLLITILIPPIQIFTVFCLPIPIILLMKAYGLKRTSVVMAILLVTSMFVAPVLSFPLTALALISGGMIGWSINHGQHPYETWAKGTAGFVLGLVLIYAYIELILQVSIMSSFENTMDQSLQMTEELFQGLGAGEQNFDLIREQMTNMLQLLPVFLVAVSMALAIITQWISYKVINKVYKQPLSFPPFRLFRLPKIILWIYFLTLIVSLFVAGDYSTLPSVAVWNVYHLAGLIIALQGLSFIFYYTHAKKQSKALPIISILVLVFFPSIGLYLLRILGIIDLGFDLRNRMAK
ncbi:YybS family protein [Gracilibacillus salinarum]|uniref:YybS family protein n=1 Tax=Gracilibacillus salinarum TaxID=2932255 RepID=A0ABY4GHX7_9BACI|nr:YybS family protein [Gracilibacillus salinarum]UOQ83781.1 YybS family protein [Gracilibacillus salinarum]